MKYLYDANGKNNPINKIFFLDVKRQLADGEKMSSESLYQGKIINLEKDTQNTYLIMENLLKNGLGKTIWFEIPNEMVLKTKVFQLVNNQETPSTFSQIKKDAVVDIYALIEYGNQYENSLLALKIVIK